MCFLVDVGDSLPCHLMVRGRDNCLKFVVWKIQLSFLFKVVFKDRATFKRGMNFLTDTLGYFFLW